MKNAPVILARPLLVVLLLVATVADGAPRRRAARHPWTVDETPESWLRLHATPLASAEIVPFDDDLDPLLDIIGEADVVALGEATHGTHEFHTVRMRIIDFLVRERGFDVVVMEAPFPLLNRVNAYVQGGDDSPRSIMLHAFSLGYYFWDVREIFDLLAWARNYNAQRGDAPPLVFAGADTYDQRAAASAVVDFLRSADPASAARIESDYSCVHTSGVGSFCQGIASEVVAELTRREAELTAQSSPSAFADALQNATVIEQYLTGGTIGTRRDEYLARNTLWLREHRGQSRRVIVWAHQEHVGMTDIEWQSGQVSMGGHLEAALGEEYVVIGTATRTGSFLQWDRGKLSTSVFQPATATGHESFFTRDGRSPLLIPLTGDVPQWLRETRTLQSAPANPTRTRTVTTSLPEKLDAIIYFETTTAARSN
jgi:erythromycin esterase